VYPQKILDLAKSTNNGKNCGTIIKAKIRAIVNIMGRIWSLNIWLQNLAFPFIVALIKKNQ
jgi:hypothetical protein